MKIICTLILCCLFTETVSGGTGSGIADDTCAARGMEAMSRGNYREAIAEFDRCIGLSPANPRFYFQRGTCYLLIRKPNIALVDLNQALRLDSSLYESYYNRGLAHQALGNYTFAEADFLLYHDRVPSDKKVLRNLALLMEEMLDYRASVRYYTMYLDRDPGDREILRSRAMAWAGMDSVDAAIRDLDACLKENHNDTSVWMSKGNVYYDAQMFAQAIDAYNVILLLYPASRPALINRADAYTASGRYEEAIRDYQKLSESDKYNPDYYFSTGFCQLQLSMNQEAILSFCKALDTEYANLGLLLTLRGVAYNNLKMKAEACSDWQNAINAGYAEASKYKLNYCQ